jgi:hypothetical protein
MSKKVLCVHSTTRSTLSILTVAVLLVQPVSAFQSPLSQESVREAYFLGQRHDGSFERLLEKCSRHLPPPKTGPYISSVAFFTPFLQIAQLSTNYVGNYSAQQAALDHRSDGKEIVKIIIEIQLTESYGQFVASAPTGLRSGSLSVLTPRHREFWRDFEVHIYDGEQALPTPVPQGRTNYNCGHYGPCIMTGATVEFDFATDAFASDSASISVDPPEGDPVTTAFDLTRLR